MLCVRALIPLHHRLTSTKHRHSDKPGYASYRLLGIVVLPGHTDKGDATPSAYVTIHLVRGPNELRRSNAGYLLAW